MEKVLVDGKERTLLNQGEEMKQKYFYKVVSENLLSSICSKERGFEISGKQKKNLFVKYELNKWVYPKIKGTKLLVFNNLKNAKYLKKTCERVFKCEVKNPKLNKTILDFYSVYHGYYSGRKLHAGIFRKFWSGGTMSYRVITGFTGTYSATAVKLIKEVK